MGYPEKHPTRKQRHDYKQFFTLLGHVLPCNLCRDSYLKYIKELRLSSKVLRCRKSLVHWLFKIHNKVNRKLKCKVLSTEQLKKKYKFFDKFRAKTCTPKYGGCVKAINGVRVPKRTKVVTYVDEAALRLLDKDRRRDKSSKSTTNS
jgi:hypothetical protein